MEYSGCSFPDDLNFSVDMEMWFIPLEKQKIRCGISSLLLWIVGKKSILKIKGAGTVVEAGKSIGSIESANYFTTLKVPFRCVIKRNNAEVEKGARLSPLSVYGRHWISLLEVDGDAREILSLHTVSGKEAEEAARQRLDDLKITCLSEIPDRTMVEIGSECSAVLSNLNSVLESSESGYIVHLVTDDITSPVEMVRWSDETHNTLLEKKKVNGIYHFLIQKK